MGVIPPPDAGRREGSSSDRDPHRLIPPWRPRAAGGILAPAAVRASTSRHRVGDFPADSPRRHPRAARRPGCRRRRGPGELPVPRRRLPQRGRGVHTRHHRQRRDSVASTPTPSTQLARQPRKCAASARRPRSGSRQPRKCAASARRPRLGSRQPRKCAVAAPDSASGRRRAGAPHDNCASARPARADPAWGRGKRASAWSARGLRIWPSPAVAPHDNCASARPARANPAWGRGNRASARQATGSRLERVPDPSPGQEHRTHDRHGREGGNAARVDMMFTAPCGIDTGQTLPVGPRGRRRAHRPS
jgi:hypothetical protein